jgi:hypothetical protein
MIINIRGTSGSGKSTVMRRVMDSCDWQAEYIPGRKRPLYYRAMEHPFAVLGPYETPCGGGDAVGSAGQIYKEVIALLTFSWCKVVLCEGLLLSEDVKWSRQLPDLRVLFLTTPLERCLEQIKKRRQEAGSDKPLNPTNTASRVATIERARIKLIASGIECRRCSADQAVGIVLNWLRLHTQQGV